MKIVELPGGERVPALGLGTWNIGDDRAQRAEEIAALAVYLAGDAAQFVTGQAIVIDGGLTL